jgi:hypothetical protein
VRLLAEGCLLRVQTPHPARVLWTVDSRSGEHDVVSRDTTLGIWIADLDTMRLPAGSVIRFAIRQDGAAIDEGHAITVVERNVAPAGRRPGAGSSAPSVPG